MIKKITRHLYIHIPFCNHICDYCDFKRFVSNDKVINKYINKILNEIKTKYRFNQFQTIYVGGGTPNVLKNDLMDKFLSTLKKYLSKNYEFTIECNPELITKPQINIFKKNKVNRISLGVQSLNPNILKQFHRQHTIVDIRNAIRWLRNSHINNISIDLLYGINEQTNKDILNVIDFIKQNKIPHVSWYALELKPNSILTKNKYVLNEEKAEEHLKLIIKSMNKYRRYEVSNWSLNKKYESLHNKAYWLSHDWAAIGLSACGFENNTYYQINGSLDIFKTKKDKLSTKDSYVQILMMGLRLKDGLDLSNPLYYHAYSYFKDQLKDVYIKNNHLIAKNLNTLNYCLIDIV